MQAEKGSSPSEYFAENGYLVVRGVLTAREVKTLREVCVSLYSQTGDSEMFASRFLATPELASVPFLPHVVRLLEQVAGHNYTVYPNFTVRTNVYPPWHVDNGFLYSDRSKREAEFVQCAVYLQQNDAVFGGGLDVVPGSQFFPAAADLEELLARAARGVTLKIEAGDMVLWDGRTLHRSTQPLVASLKTKMALYWTVSRKGVQTAGFLKHLAGRAVREIEGRAMAVPRYEDVQTIRFPDGYPQEAVEAIRRHGLAVASHSELAETA